MDFKKQPNGLLTYGEWNGIHYALDNTYSIVKTYEAKNGYVEQISMISKFCQMIMS